ncbi:MAG: leucyl/phenylalanyl-tRNA--protein transferase [Alphaproteobacteria bacterium]|nr:leucyl/phenylalanyl-tRNA--protein transferase [Alphaproteobacteria bacterium]
MQIELTPEILLAAYSQGLFPMAQSKDSPCVDWVCPQIRGQLSIANMHIPGRLAKSVRQMKLKGQPYEIRINTKFSDVIKECAAETKDRSETWINQDIIDAYTVLHDLGYAHSVECWQDNALIGGLYGLAIGGAFFGESMYSKARDASKVTLVHLVARLYHAKYEILDTQFTNDHLQQFGVYEVSHQDYMQHLNAVLCKRCEFSCDGVSEKVLINNYSSFT